MLTLLEIPESGELPQNIVVDDFLGSVVDATKKLYAQVGFAAPWVGYIAVTDEGPVGVCGFKSPPQGDQVEIAYATLSGHEGCGVATAMARELIQIACKAAPALTVIAQTLPEESASTTILTKLGFTLAGDVEHPEDGTVWEWRLATGRG